MDIDVLILTILILIWRTLQVLPMYNNILYSYISDYIYVTISTKTSLYSSHKNLNPFFGPAYSYTQ